MRAEATILTEDTHTRSRMILVMVNICWAIVAFRFLWRHL